jgi:hypothetical protein
MVTILATIGLMAVGMVATASTASAAVSSVVIDGAFATTTIRPRLTSRCPSGAGDECGVFQLVGLGSADYVYVYVPTFEPTGK